MGSKEANMVVSGYCESDCNKFPYFIILLAMSGIVSSTARTGNSLITMRCVDQKDKSFAMGVLGSVMAVLSKYRIHFELVT